MTTYTFTANFKSAAVDWENTSIWVGGIVPNAPDADVVIPAITNVAPGNATTYDIAISAGEAYAERSVTLAGNNVLDVSGSLKISGNLTMQSGGLTVEGTVSASGTLALQQSSSLSMSGGTLSVGSLQEDSTSSIYGQGTINSASNFVNAGAISGSYYGTLTINIGAGSFQNTGTMSADGNNLSVNTAAGGFGNLSGGVLTGGTYTVSSIGKLNLNGGGAITTDAATIDLYDGTISSGGSPLEATLQTIAPSGVLAIQDETFTISNALTVEGTLSLFRTEYAAPAGVSAPQFVVTAGGQINGFGIITGQVTNNGIISAGFAEPGQVLPVFGSPPLPPQSLVIKSAISGAGSLLVGAGVSYSSSGGGLSGTVLELGGAVTENVGFADSTGILQLDAPSTFSGTIAPDATGDTIVLENVALSSITSETYTGSTQGGTLVLHRAAGDLSINFQGNYTLSSFMLTAGVQQTSTSPASVIIAPTVGANSTSGSGTVACYCRGTLILTTDGEVPVEALTIGDRVITASHVEEPIRWIGRRSYAGRFLAANPAMVPILFRAGSLGGWLPRRDLRVSPLHAMFLDGLLVPAWLLANGVTITRERDVQQVEYFHIELDEHDVILAEGAPSESFVDDESRGMFHNASEWYGMHPGRQGMPALYCATRVEDGFELEAIRRRLASIANEVVQAA